MDSLYTEKSRQEDCNRIYNVCVMSPHLYSGEEGGLWKTLFVHVVLGEIPLILVIDCLEKNPDEDPNTAQGPRHGSGVR